MQTSTAGDDAAILALGSQVRYTATFTDLDGGPVVVTNFNTGREVKDVPNEINLLEGLAAGKASFTLASAATVAALSPFVGSLSSADVNSKVTVQAQFLTASGWGTNFTMFTGWVTSVSPSSDGTAQVEAVETGATLAGSLTLPAGCSLTPAGLTPTADVLFSPLTVVDLALRAAGVFLTPAPNVTARDRASVTVLAMSGCGGYIPEIGVLTSGALGGTRVAGKWTPDVVSGYGVTMNATRALSELQAQIQYVWMDFWFRVPSGAANQNVLLVDVLGVGSISLSSASGGVTLTDKLVNSGTPLNVNVAAAQVNDNTWHYCALKATVTTAGAVTFQLTLDSTTATSGSLTGNAPLATGNGTCSLNLSSTAAAAVEGLELVLIPFGSSVSVPTSRNAAAAGKLNLITATSTRLKAVAPQTGLSPWGVVQAVAQAEGAIAGFDEQDRFVFTPLAAWRTGSTGSALQAIGPGRHQGLSFTISNENVFNSVTVAVTPVSAAADSAASPAYSASEQLDFPPGTSTRALEMPSGSSLFNPPWSTKLTKDTGSGTAFNWVSAIATSAVGDPAANLVSNLNISIRPTPTGFSVTVRNPNSFSVSFVDPTSSGANAPYFIVHGTVIRVGTPVTLTSTGNPAAPSALPIEDNQWRQDLVQGQRLCDAVAGDVTVSIPVFQSVRVPGDPRIQLGDLVTVQDNLITPTAYPVRVVGVNHEGAADVFFTTTLTLRAIGSPRGWLMGVPGRSVMGVSTTPVGA